MRAVAYMQDVGRGKAKRGQRGVVDTRIGLAQADGRGVDDGQRRHGRLRSRGPEGQPGGRPAIGAVGDEA